MTNNVLTFTYVLSYIAIFIEISVVESQALYSKDEMCDRNGYRTLDEVRNVLYPKVERYAQLLADQNKILAEQNNLLERQVQLLRSNQELNGSKSDINECFSRPCQNRGTCIDLINSYRCNCAPGFNGRNCENNINDCLSRPCQNRGTCRDLINSYRCNCAPGFNGRNCETNTNECLSRPCQNRGTCRDLINSYRCICASGFSGRNCEININECLSRPCQNRGTCRDLINSYRCNCAPGFNGRNCEITLSCQGGWTKFNTKCFFFDSSITRTWTAAMRYCEGRGGTLAVPSNSYENDFLKDIGNNSDLNSIWIGISDSSTEGRWLIYPDRVLISFYTFTDWSPGEPSQTWNGEEEDCGCMSGYSNIRYRWNDAPCSRYFNFICEKELS